MGLKGYGTVQSGPAFGQDVLRIKMRGKTALNLTIVDIPRIIQVPNDEQDDNDVDTVHALVTHTSPIPVRSSLRSFKLGTIYPTSRSLKSSRSSTRKAKGLPES